MSRQCEEMIETNKQMQRTIKDAELRIQQLETNKVQVSLCLLLVDLEVCFAFRWRKNWTKPRH